MNYSFTNKNVSNGDKTIITDWRQMRVISPENLQGNVRANEIAKKEIQKQKEVVPTTSNKIATAVA